jgi:hypothetical protein
VTSDDGTPDASPAFRIGSDWRFFRSAIDQWIVQHEITNPPVTRGHKSKVS